MLGKLGGSLRGAIDKIKGAVFIDKRLTEEVVKEIQRALISSDVNVRLVFDLSKRIKERALNEKLPAGLDKKQHVVKIVYDELREILGTGKSAEIKKQKILLVGLYGSGKTTTSAKIARYFKKKGLKPSMISTDTWRPAAYEQLRQMGEKVGVPVYGNPEEKNPIQILKEAMEKSKDSDVTIIDSAGRDSVEEELLEEIRSLNKELQPDETWLVLSGDIGQKAGAIAKIFDESIGLTGVIITKMEGTAKGGGALSAVAQVNQRIIFIGTGERVEDLEEFEPDRFLQKMLGFGDIKSLMEKVQDVMQEEEFDPEQMLKQDYTIETFYKQLQAQRKMGPLKNVVQMMGLGAKMPDDVLKASEDRMVRYKYIIESMAKKERKNPDILSASRIERIAKGSGTKISDVKHMIDDYNKSKKLINMFKKGKLPRQFRRLMGSMGQ